MQYNRYPQFPFSMLCPICCTVQFTVTPVCCTKHCALCSTALTAQFVWWPYVVPPQVDIISLTVFPLQIGSTSGVSDQTLSDRSISLNSCHNLLLFANVVWEECGREMSDLRLSNKICWKGKTQTGQYKNWECDMQCSKYQEKLIKINRCVQKAQSCYCKQMPMQFLYFNSSPFSIKIYIIKNM